MSKSLMTARAITPNDPSTAPSILIAALAPVESHGTRLSASIVSCCADPSTICTNRSIAPRSVR